MNSDKRTRGLTPARDNLLRWVLALALFSMAASFAPSPAAAQESAEPAADSAATSDSAASASATAPAGTPGAIGIAAIVNDHIISRFDLEQRAKLFMVTSGIPPTAENLNRIEGQVLRTLIDETLEMQEGERLGVSADPKDVQNQLAAIAQRANMTPDQVLDILQRGGLTPSTLIDQITADIVWNTVVSQRFGGQVTVRAEEVNDVMAQLQSEANEPRYQISEIYLTVDSPSQEAEISSGAQRLAEEMRKGAPFEAVARQFSQSASAANGGDIGWVHLSQLPTEVAPIVQNMESGTVSDPIKAANGYYIIALRSKQSGIGGPDPMQDIYTLLHILFPLAPDAPSAAVNLRAEQVGTFVRGFGGCDVAAEQLKKYMGAMAEPPKQVEFGQLDPKLRGEIQKSGVGKIITPIRTRSGIEMVAICGRQENKTSMPTREAVESNLFGQQMAMLARRYLRDLRHDAVIEYR